MMSSFRQTEILADTGLIALCDAGTGRLRGETVADLRADLRRAAASGELFLLDEEDSVELRIGLVVAQAAPTELVERYRRYGGAFRLQASSGELRLSPAELEGAKVSPQELRLSVEPGTYQVLAWAPPEFDPQESAAQELELLGESDLRYRRTQDLLGAVGCLLLVPAAVMVLIPALRSYWPVALVLLLPWLLHQSVARLPRARRIERKLAEDAQELCAYVLQLAPIDPKSPLPGGWLRGS